MTPSSLLGFPGGSVVKNLPADTGDAGSVPGLGRFPGEGNGTFHSSILVWNIPSTGDPGRLQSTGLQRVEHNHHIFSFKLSL